MDKPDSSDAPQVSWTVHIEKRAEKYIKKQSPQEQRQLLKAIRGLKNYPDEGDIKPLVNRPEWRMRVGNKRIIFRVLKEKSIIAIIAIGPRGDIYKK